MTFIRDNKLSLVIVFFIILGVVALIGNLNKTSDNIVNVHATGDIIDKFTSVDALSQRAEYIVEISASNVEPLVYGDVAFTLTNGKVEKVYKGELKESTINILETGGIKEVDINGDKRKVNIVFEDNEVFRPGQKAIVFIEKYKGPITDDAYVILGVFQGKFLLDGENLTPPKNGLEGIKKIVDLKL